MAVSLCAWASWGCGAECVDHDGDGYGEHCGKGADCDDDDPRLGASCNVEVPNCDDDRYVEGCPCLKGQIASCYSAPDATQDVGICRAGSLACTHGYFSRCVGAVLPDEEVCNGQDDDCDGKVDEGVLSPCGGCNPKCMGGVWGPPLLPFEPTATLALTAEGELTLRRTPRETHLLWVANTEGGSLSKVDTEREQELARYRTAGGNPTRVAVDDHGAAWVLDASSKGRGTLTKIAADRDECLAADGGKTVTSQGPSDVLPLGEDTCVRVSLPVGEKGDDPQALALDGARDPDSDLVGNVWVGMAHAHEVVQLSGATGEPLSRVALSGFAPHVAQFDPWGTLWLVDRDGLLASVDMTKSPPKVRVREIELPCYTLESLAIDERGRLLLSGFSCENVIAYDPAQDRVEEVMTTGLLTPRGIAIDGEEAWVAFTSGSLGHLTRSPLAIDTVYDLGSGGVIPFETIGLSLDSRGRVWVTSAKGGEQGKGLLTAFDPVTEKVDAQLTVGLGPRAQGDMTGVMFGGDLAHAGAVSRVFFGCGHESRIGDAGLAGRETEWQRVHVDAQFGPDAAVDVEARWAEDQDGLSAETFQDVGTLPRDSSPLPLEFPEGGVLEVRVRLRADGALGAPRLRNVGVEWTCPGPE